MDQLNSFLEHGILLSEDTKMKGNSQSFQEAHRAGSRSGMFGGSGAD